MTKSSQFARLPFLAGVTPTPKTFCDADLDILQSLVEKSSLRHRRPLLDARTIREFAREQLQQLADSGEIDERHAQWYLRLAKKAQASREEQPQRSRWRRLDAELENLREHRSATTTHAWRSSWSARPGTPSRGPLREALNYLVHALETARSTSFDHAELLRGAGSVAKELGDYAASQEWFEEPRASAARPRRRPADRGGSLAGLV